MINCQVTQTLELTHHLYLVTTAQFVKKYGKCGRFFVRTVVEIYFLNINRVNFNYILH